MPAGRRAVGRGAPAGSPPTWLWQAAKVWLLMMLHLRTAQAWRKRLRPQGFSRKLVSAHSGLSFHEFTNSSSLDATYVLRVSKSSFMFPLSLPHRPHRAPCGGRGQARGPPPPGGPGRGGAHGTWAARATLMETDMCLFQTRVRL